MMRAAALLLLVLLAAPAVAEEETPATASAPKHVVHKRARKPASKPASKPAIPAAPIPYSTYAGLPPEVAKALTPGADAAPAPVPTQPAEAPPPPPPAPAVESAPPPPPAPSEISLRCETTLEKGRKTLSSGTFYIDLFPSPVFPDEHADFRFLFVDPAHTSLVRDTMCLDVTCTADVSGAAYALVSRRAKKGAALRITLDRATGGFYAEEMDGGGSDHVGEHGTCVPQPLPHAIF